MTTDKLVLTQAYSVIFVPNFQTVTMRYETKTFALFFVCLLSYSHTSAIELAFWSGNTLAATSTAADVNASTMLANGQQTIIYNYCGNSIEANSPNYFPNSNSPNKSKYYRTILTPSCGNALQLNQVRFRVTASNGDFSFYDVGVIVDGGPEQLVVTKSFFNNNGCPGGKNANHSFANITAECKIEVRIYIYGPKSGSGYAHLRQIRLNGNVIVASDPTTNAATGIGCNNFTANWNQLCNQNALLQVQSYDGSTYTDIFNGVTPGSSQNFNSLTETEYRYRIQRSCDGTFSAWRDVNLPSTSIITVQPTDETVCTGTNTSFTVNGTAGSTYKWYEDNGITSAPIPGAPGAFSKLEIPVSYAKDGYEYYVEVTNSGCTETSNAAKLTVEGAEIVTDLSDVTVCEGANANFTVTVQGSSDFEYQWIKTSPPAAGIKATNVVASTSNTFTLPGVTTAQDGETYAVLVTDASSCDPATSSFVTLNVDPSPTITTDLQDQTVCAVGDVATFEVQTNPGPWEYLFYNITDNLSLPGGVTPTFTPDNFRDITTVAGDNGDEFYVFVRNSGNILCSAAGAIPGASLNIAGIGGTAGVWTGDGLDGDWANCENWDDGNVPTATTDVLIDDANTINPLDISTMPLTTTVNNLTLNVSGANNPINTGPSARNIVVNGTLDLQNGYLQVSIPPFTNDPVTSGYLFVTSGDANDVTYNNGFVHGYIFQNTAGSSQTYNFPVGDPMDGLNAIALDFQAPSDHGLLLAAYRKDLTATIPASIQSSTECGQNGYTTTLANVIWRVESGGFGSVPYNLSLFPSTSVAGNYTPVSGDKAATIMKSPSSATTGGHSWTLEGSCAPGLGASNLAAAQPIVTRLGLTSFSDFAVILDSNDPFPVQWLHFDAERISASEVALDWATAVEENNAGFYLQRSTDGVFFQDFDFVEGGGTRSSISNYAAFDQEATAERLFYRLRQVDFDGKTDFSNVVEIAPMGASSDFLLSVYPNPFERSVTLKSDLPTDSQVSLTLFGIDGKRIYAQQGNFGSVAATFESQSANLSAGAYLLQIEANGQRKNMKLIKQ